VNSSGVKWKTIMGTSKPEAFIELCIENIQNKRGMWKTILVRENLTLSFDSSNRLTSCQV
jgi:hypothetical protein